MLEKKAPCNDCKHASDPTIREVRWNLPHDLKEVLNLLERSGHDLSLFTFCTKQNTIESLIGGGCEDEFEEKT